MIYQLLLLYLIISDHILMKFYLTVIIFLNSKPNYLLLNIMKLITRNYMPDQHEHLLKRIKIVCVCACLHQSVSFNKHL